MGGIGPEEAGRMTLWQFTAMRYIWNARHTNADEADDDIEPPDVEFVRARHAELMSGPVSGKAH